MASEARLASGAELAGLAFYEVDFDAGTMYSDDRLRDLCGVPPDRWTASRSSSFWMEHLHPDDRPRVVELRRQLHEGERDRFSIEYRYLHPERGEMWIQHLAGAAARDASGRAVRTYGVFRDVTDRKRAEEEAARPEPAPHPRPGGGARAARARAARRREPAARRAGDRRRPRRARRRGRASRPRAMQAVREGLVEPQRRRPLPGLPAPPIGPGGARPGRGASRGMRTAGPARPARRHGRPRPAARRPRRGRRALPVPGRPGGAEQRGPPRRRLRDRHAAADRTTGWSSPCPTTASASTRSSPDRGCTWASPACANACGWCAARSTSRARPARARRSSPGCPSEGGASMSLHAPAARAPRRRPPPGRRGADEPAQSRVRSGGRGRGRAPAASRRPGGCDRT